MPGVIRSLEDALASVADGCILAVPRETSGVAMAATRALIRRGVYRLHLIALPTSTLQADLLIGAGRIATLETSAVSLGEFGPAPRFTAALLAGALRMRDATCPALHAQFQAAEKGVPFMPLRGLIGSDLLAHRADWKVVDNPFGDDDPIVLLPALKPEVALFHAPLADREGNVFIGRWRELLTLAHAARQTLITVEEITERDLMAEVDLSPGVIPALYVTSIALARHGAWPLRFGDHYPLDQDAVESYAAAARTEAGFRSWVGGWLSPQPTQALA